MSPSEWDTRTDNHALEVLLSSVKTDQPEIGVLLVSLALAMHEPRSHDSSMNDLALTSGALLSCKLHAMKIQAIQELEDWAAASRCHARGWVENDTLDRLR